MRPGINLLPYQIEGKQFLLEKGSALLGDEVGLGKTIQSLAVVDHHLHHDASVTTLIFCPSILKYQWRTEILKFLDVKEDDIVVIEGTAKKRKEQWSSKAKFYIANYELIQRDFKLIDQRAYTFIIADEATRLSNPFSNTVAGAVVPHSRPKRRVGGIKALRSVHRLALTGTPVSNSAQDVWSILDWVQPKCLGNYWSFINKYCVKNFWGAITASKNVDLLAQLIEPHIIRRLKVDVLPQLPDKIMADVSFELSDDEQKLYDQIKKDLLFEIQDIDISKILNPVNLSMTLPKMMALRRLANGMELVGTKQKSSKLEALKELMSQLGDKKVIIFTEFSDMADILYREFLDKRPLVISGEVNDPGIRAKTIDTFNTDPNFNLLVMTSAGQFGLNIQSASVVIHYDQPWSLAKLVQREGRAHRMGQKESVLVYNLLGRKTIDEYIAKKLLSKKDLSSRLLLEDIMEMLE